LGGAGGGHGGDGGNSGTFAGGLSYGSVTQPITLGSGGGSWFSNPGGAGGGAVRLIVSGALTLNGSIVAIGVQPGPAAGAGAGGSIWISAGSLSGTGTLQARGGNGGQNSWGGGGGGRIAVYACSIASSLTSTVAGGSANNGNGQPGTIILDNDGLLVTSQPADRTSCLSGTVNFSVAVTGFGPFTYQWQWQPAGPNTAWAALANGINTDDQGTPAFDVSGATTAAVAIRSISGLVGPVGNFRCIVTNACGSVTSNEATLTICAADFNCDGDLNPDDLADYIGAYFAQPEGAGSDFNADGTTDPDDLADFIGAFFAGCG